MSQKYFQIYPACPWIKWIKKKPLENFLLHFFQSFHQVDMKNVDECLREFFAYFNALETYSGEFRELLRISENTQTTSFLNFFLISLE